MLVSTSFSDSDSSWNPATLEHPASLLFPCGKWAHWDLCDIHQNKVHTPLCTELLGTELVSLTRMITWLFRIPSSWPASPSQRVPLSCAHPLPLVRFPCSAREWWAVPMETGTPGSSTVADSEVQSMCLWTPLLSRLNPNPFLERVLRRKSDIKQVKLQHFAHSRPSAERLVIRLTLFKPNPGYFLKKTPHWEL